MLSCLLGHSHHLFLSLFSLFISVSHFFYTFPFFPTPLHCLFLGFFSLPAADPVLTSSLSRPPLSLPLCTPLSTFSVPFHDFLSSPPLQPSPPLSSPFSLHVLFPAMGARTGEPNVCLIVLLWLLDTAHLDSGAQMCGCHSDLSPSGKYGRPPAPEQRTKQLCDFLLSRDRNVLPPPSPHTHVSRQRKFEGSKPFLLWLSCPLFSPSFLVLSHPSSQAQSFLSMFFFLNTSHPQFSIMEC